MKAEQVELGNLDLKNVVKQTLDRKAQLSQTRRYLRHNVSNIHFNVNDDEEQHTSMNSGVT
uniref:Uncharacterized protein n=1 Tax=Arion vulgaris TaxID=1028688 RepID=A0A0B7AB38_9EUPU